ncbi:hypothetical protein AYL99_06860 [Fonsecaea erecta]|uniref:Uncharacterized protein n=1 Tax=Fonsecaea erecta TaxID=1367422 RepID=A0A178ZIR5_9EURO|nr:hypothetical protein AYL99_06860 [Fonsecaea erecta]OAP59562.1 hypothetical protein AYL99_06860 [Fonsecaea erecta]
MEKGEGEAVAGKHNDGSHLGRTQPTGVAPGWAAAVEARDWDGSDDLALSSNTVPIFTASGLFASVQGQPAVSSRAMTTTTDASGQQHGAEPPPISLQEVFHSLAQDLDMDGPVQTSDHSENGGRVNRG